MEKYFKEMHLRKSSFNIICMDKNSMYDMIAFWKIIHMEAHNQDGKRAFIFFFSLLRTVVDFVMGRLRETRILFPGYWPVQRGKRRKQQSAIYQEKAISAHWQKSEGTREDILE